MPMENVSAAEFGLHLMRNLHHHPTVKRWKFEFTDAELSFDTPESQATIVQRIVERSNLAIYRSRNYRGVEAVVEELVTEPVLAFIEAYASNSTHTSPPKPFRFKAIRIGVNPHSDTKSSRQLKLTVELVPAILPSGTKAKDEL